ncbi:MAG: peptidoglycan-binding domain-containing protein [Pseudomonadota bacterium]
MPSKHLTAGLTAAALVLTPATRAAADAGDFIGGAIIGGIVGGIITNEANKKKRTTQRTVKRSTVSSATRNANRETQTALNYFSFPAGTPDGILGRNSRNAISQFQAHMGYPVSGQLTQFQRDFLVSSYYRASNNAIETAQLMNQQPNGTRGLLTAYANQATRPAITPTPAPIIVQQTPQIQQAGVVPVPQAPVTQVVTPAPQQAAATAAIAAPAAALPVFGQSDTPASMASHCNRISVLTTSNGGLTAVSEVSDTAFALSEQFCLARSFAVLNGEAEAARVGVTDLAKIDAQCEAFAPAMQPMVSSLSLSPRDAVLGEVMDFIRTSGLAPAQLVSTGTICLSSGYRTDTPDIAIGSALILTAVGELAYAEVLGHHLSEGFGATARPDLAQPWYQMAVTGLENGATQAFAPGQDGRVQLLRVAAGLSAPAATTPAVSVIPNFGQTSN